MNSISRCMTWAKHYKSVLFDEKAPERMLKSITMRSMSRDRRPGSRKRSIRRPRLVISRGDWTASRMYPCSFQTGWASTLKCLRVFGLRQEWRCCCNQVISLVLTILYVSPLPQTLHSTSASPVDPSESVIHSNACVHDQGKRSRRTRKIVEALMCKSRI